ncbi:uncharacterized protein BN514_01228 [Ruminococcus sp. CAG:17]|jgi:hypothetical protein|nr:uncharacterized protein BN514_01228 [Ruminococcus sp. CAG:17]DAG83529.1 MAG TPA: hypothetical protein [Bacteriophage sp.]DAZ19278.1 MAG TPA: hypothetical protein [Caudoviricetes sp.]
MGFTITSDQIIWFCTIVGGIWGIWKIIKELRKPNEDLRLTVKKHSELLDNDNRRLKNSEETNRKILQCLLVIINHEITGNGIDKMKETRDALQEYLINK